MKWLIVYFMDLIFVALIMHACAPDGKALDVQPTPVVMPKE